MRSAMKSKLQSKKDKYHALENKHEYVLFLLIGLFSDLDQGYTSTMGFTKYVHVADWDGAPQMLSMFIGGIIGVSLTTFILMKFKPRIRVAVNALIMIAGIFFAWFLSSPVNVYLGFGGMYMGQYGLQATILPLTYYVGAHATSMYQAGYAAAPLVGSGIMQIHDATNSGEAARMITAMIFPIMIAILFFFVDQTQFTKDEHKKNDDVDVEASTATSQSADDEEEKMTSERLTKADMMKAFKEIRYLFVPLYMAFALIYGIYNVSVNTYYTSSSLSYMGKTVDNIFDFQDKLAVISAFISTGVGLTILTPLGRIITTQNPKWLWFVPLIILISMTTILVGMYHNAFPPMHGGAFYFLYFLNMSILPPIFNIYAPLFVSNCESLSSKYNEFQMQISLALFMGGFIVVAIFGLLFFSNSVLGACETNYEANYDGVTCTLFS